MTHKFFTVVMTAGATTALSLAVCNTKAIAVTINFDDQGLTGPSLFFNAIPSPQTIPITVGGVTATFTGGVVLTNTSNLPANQTSIYGTASFGTGLTNPLVINFSQSITNFFLDVLNGNTETIQYTVADNNGNSSTFSLPPNLSGGQTQIGFAATGTQVTITSSIGSSIPYDFFIDNITFNEALPPNLGTSVPEPFTVIGTLVGGTAALRMRKKLKSNHKV